MPVFLGAIAARATHLITDDVFLVHPLLSHLLPGCLNEEQQDNLASLELHLTSEQIALPDEASAIEAGSPYDLCKRGLVRNLAYGRMRENILEA